MSRVNGAVRIAFVYSAAVVSFMAVPAALAARELDRARPAAPQAACLTLLEPTNSVDFGQRALGVLGAAHAVTLGNSGLQSLDIGSVVLAGLDPSEFVVRADDCTGATLAPEQSCSLLVDFAPSSLGNKSARLRMADTAPGSPHDIPLSGTGFDPATPSRQTGPIDVRYGFPIWYQDDAGLRVTLCYDNNGLCTNPLPSPALQPSVSDALVNFPEEMFWSYAEANIPRFQRRNGGGRVRLILSKEAAFLPGPAAVGQQIAFDRVRVRIDRLTPGAVYTITYPFGVLQQTADDDGDIDYTNDIGCGGPPCAFSLVLGGPLGRHLRWDQAFQPQAPAGYLGDPAVVHRIVGSPLGTNLFRVAGPNAGGLGINVIETNLFVLEGKLF